MPSQQKFIQALDGANDQTGWEVFMTDAVSDCRILERGFPACALQAFGAGESMDSD